MSKVIFFALLCLNLAFSMTAQAAGNDSRFVYPKKIRILPPSCPSILAPEEDLGRQLKTRINSFRNEMSTLGLTFRPKSKMALAYAGFEGEANELLSEIESYLKDSTLPKPTLRRCLEGVRADFEKLLARSEELK